MRGVKLFETSSALPVEEMASAMFDARYSEAEARRARRLESIYHRGQEKIWDGREILESLIAKHGKPQIAPEKRRSLARIFSIIMWGELAAWKISAQLADCVVPLEAKMAAASQVHDEARHFYVMHDYLKALGDRPPALDFWSRRVVDLPLRTPDLHKKLAGMQLTIETIALTIFQRVRELDVEPVLCELLTYYERDEARHVGLGVQFLPPLVGELSAFQQVDLAVFQLKMLTAVVMSLKSMEQDLRSIGIDPRSILAVGTRKHADLQASIRAEFPNWPEDPPVTRIFDALCELVFPGEDAGVELPPHKRVALAIAVARRLRPGVNG